VDIGVAAENDAAVRRKMPDGTDIVGRLAAGHRELLRGGLAAGGVSRGT
jgi:hypothetical protein